MHPDPAQGEARAVHRIEMIDTEINVLRSMYQSSSYSEGEKSLMIKHTVDLCRERRECEEVLGHDVPDTRAS